MQMLCPVALLFARHVQLVRQTTTIQGPRHVKLDAALVLSGLLRRVRAFRALPDSGTQILRVIPTNVKHVRMENGHRLNRRCAISALPGIGKIRPGKIKRATAFHASQVNSKQHLGRLQKVTALHAPMESISIKAAEHLA
jgi:hypothetical protein